MTDERLRYVVIGVGASIFDAHRVALSRPQAEVVAACDASDARGHARAEALGCTFFTNHQQMLVCTEADVAVILTPHPSHAAIATDCLQAGCHVLVEKPMAVHVAEADAMIEAARDADRLLAVCFQQRCRAEVQAARALITNGDLGAIQHVSMATTWTRTAAYYASAPWRGTWNGEGGGVLLNQAPHNLDLLCVLLGQPHRVVAWTRTRLHSIETEDTVEAMLEWANGALGSFHASTAEASVPERLDIIGTGGGLQLDSSGLRVSRFDPDVRQHIQQNPAPFAAPDEHDVSLKLASGSGDHAAIYDNLHNAILHGTPLIADGAAARDSLELANAMIYSSHTNATVELPLDRRAYAALLGELRGSEWFNGRA